MSDNIIVDVPDVLQPRTIDQLQAEEEEMLRYLSQYLAIMQDLRDYRDRVSPPSIEQ